MALSRPVVYGGLVVLVLGVWVWSAPADVPHSPPPPKPKKKAPKVVESDFVEADYTARFKSPSGRVKNLFVPLVASNSKTAPDSAAPPVVLDHIPPDLADGDGGWEYTGFAQVNGKKMALLENGAKHQSGFVHEGDAWKQTHVMAISRESIELFDATNGHQVVFRFDPNAAVKPKPEASSGFHPLVPTSALSGPIGANIVVRPLAPPSRHP